jgi:hypothetical protein
VEANYRGRGKWYKGKVTRDRGDNTFDISYDNGESEMRVAEDMIRLLDGGGSGAGAIRARRLASARVRRWRRTTVDAVNGTRAR